MFYILDLSISQFLKKVAFFQVLWYYPGYDLTFSVLWIIQIRKPLIMKLVLPEEFYYLSFFLPYDTYQGFMEYAIAFFMGRLLGLKTCKYGFHSLHVFIKIWINSNEDFDKFLIFKSYYVPVKICIYFSKINQLSKIQFKF